MIAVKGQFIKGRKESPETRDKRLKSCVAAWPNRKNYHGMYNTKFYNSWRSMITRCRGTAGEGSKRKYKDKGIVVCERWQKFKNFYDDMYPTYKEGLTIDRLDNSKGYFLENCRWADHFEQAENRHTTIWIEYHGMKKTLKQWAEHFNINLNGLRFRYHHGYAKGKISIDRLFQPKSQKFELEIITKP